MLKKEIAYEDFLGNKQNESFFFNLTKTELTELEVKYPGGFGGYLQKIAAEQNAEKMYDVVKELVLKSYGEISLDGKKHLKSEEKRKEFECHAAFDALMSELTTDADKMSEFVLGIMPAELSKEARKTLETKSNS